MLYLILSKEAWIVYDQDPKLSSLDPNIRSNSGSDFEVDRLTSEEGPTKIRSWDLLRWSLTIILWYLSQIDTEGNRVKVGSKWRQFCMWKVIIIAIIEIFIGPRN